uniref:Uncharacterized protein n=1 Tax=Meloidogyne incognita TaxID=6306 RepID=A0A914LMQ8_MELIC
MVVAKLVGKLKLCTQSRIETRHNLVENVITTFSWCLTCLLCCTDDSKVRDNLLGVLSFTGTRFTGDQHRLVFAILDHVTISFISNREQMRGHFISSLADIRLDHTLKILSVE